MATTLSVDDKVKFWFKRNSNIKMRVIGTITKKLRGAKSEVEYNGKIYTVPNKELIKLEE